MRIKNQILDLMDQLAGQDETVKKTQELGY